MNSLNEGHAEQLARLYAALGDHIAGGRQDGIFSARLGGPGSVVELADLDAPHLQLDLMPFSPTPQQRAALSALGYTLSAEDAHRLNFTHPAALSVTLLSHDLGHSHGQQVLWAELTDPSARGLRAEYRRVFVSAGREAADAALWPAARRAWLERTRFAPLERVRALLEPLDLPWMFAAGWALDLYRLDSHHQHAAGLPSRPHEDVDVILPRESQMPVCQALEQAGYTVHGVREGRYVSWREPLEAPDFQMHAHRPEDEMLDLMLTDLSGEHWHYRRDPAISLPLTRARHVSVSGLPYLAPEAALLFKANPSQVRPKDQQDFEGVLPALDAAARAWLSARIGEGHVWQASLNPAEVEPSRAGIINPE